MMLRIVGLNFGVVIYQVKMRGQWKQYIKTVGNFVHMMYVLFPDIMKQSEKYGFNDVYQIVDWLYSYGEEVKPCETYIFYYKR